MADSSVPEGPSAGAYEPTWMLQKAESALEDLRDMGIRVNPSSRFPRQLATLRNWVSEGLGTNLDAHSLAELRELVMIVDAFGGATDPDVLSKLQSIVGDPVDPRDSKAETPGRDTQFELLLGSILKGNGLDIAIEEPDLIASTGLLHIALAAKRLKSPKTIAVRIDDAHQQLRRAAAAGRATHGIIALDVTRLANTDAEIAVDERMTDHELGVARDLTARASSIIQDKADLPRVLEAQDRHVACGVLLIAHAMLFLPAAGGLITSWSLLRLKADKRFDWLLRVLEQGPTPLDS